MGDDTVLMVNSASGSINLYWNIDTGMTDDDDRPIKYSAPVGNDEGLLETVVDADGDVIYGRVVREPVLAFTTPTTPPADAVNDLLNEEYTLLITSGNLDADGLPTIHIAAAFSDEAIDFTLPPPPPPQA